MKTTKNSPQNSAVSRRQFLKTAGAASLAAASATSLAAALPSSGLAADAAAGSQTMPKRKLGKTGADVPILALGGMFDTINNQLLLKQAHAWGVTYWDTAEAYGNGLSEEGYGRYLQRNPDARKDIFLVTKLVPHGGDDFTTRLDASLKRLSTDHVDLFFVHGVSSIDEAAKYKDWAAEMKKAGKIRSFGFSSHSNMEDSMMGAAKLDFIDAIMVAYNYRLMRTQKMREALDACAKAGIGVVAMKTQGGGPVKSDSEEELKLAGHFLQRGFTDKQAKLKAVWEEPNIASICSQMPNLTILAANVAAARDKTSLAACDRELFTNLAHATKNTYCAGCGSICRNATGGLVAVNDVMRCLMYYREYGEPALARETFASLPDATRQNLTQLDYTAAEEACPHGLEIAQLMREAGELLA